MQVIWIGKLAVKYMLWITLTLFGIWYNDIVSLASSYPIYGTVELLEIHILLKIKPFQLQCCMMQKWFVKPLSLIDFEQPVIMRSKDDFQIWNHYWTIPLNKNF